MTMNLSDVVFTGNLKKFRKDLRETLSNLNPSWFMDELAHLNYQGFAQGLVPHIAKLLETKFSKDKAETQAKAIVRDLEAEGVLLDMAKFIYTTMGGGILVWFNKAEFVRRVRELNFTKASKIKEVILFDVEFFNKEVESIETKALTMQPKALKEHFGWLDEMVARKELEP